VERTTYLTRSFKSELAVREQQEGQQEKVIEGYFAVYGSETELWPGAFEEIKSGKIYVKDKIEELLKKKEGEKTDIILENGARLILKYGRFGAYLESEKFKEDNVRKTIPKDIKTKIENNTIKRENGILCLKEIFEKIEAENAAILKKAGKCEKCGKPFEIKSGRWGKFLACTGYPECKNIKKIEKK